MRHTDAARGKDRLRMSNVGALKIGHRRWKLLKYVSTYLVTHACSASDPCMAPDNEDSSAIISSYIASIPGLRG